ncbi:MAG TPA: TlpA disulfide reductase family protein [Solirubrobacteraceae bacterium]|nr:TlpA disulfide reductase family protein [Solirubrobacteraceae bacterium]
MRPRLYWPVTLAAAALIGLLAYGVFSTGADTTLDEAVARGERVDPPLADLQVLGSNGTASLADYQGKVVLVNVWASWCAPCRDELPLLEQTHRRLSRQGGTVLGIDVKENSGAALDAVAEFGLSYPNLRDPDGSYVREFGQTGYPETYVLDRQGRVAAVRRFPVTREWLDRTLPPLLEERV